MPVSLGDERLRRDYATRQAETGAPVTVLQIGAEQTRIASGHGPVPDAVLALDIGTRRTAAAHFRHEPPTADELENAIMTVEDALAPARARIVAGSALFCSDAMVRELAQLAGLPDRPAVSLSREAIERLFDRLGRVALGRPAALEGLPARNDLATTLLILREFSHHMDFAAVRI